LPSELNLHLVRPFSTNSCWETPVPLGSSERQAVPDAAFWEAEGTLSRASDAEAWGGQVMSGEQRVRK